MLHRQQAASGIQLTHSQLALVTSLFGHVKAENPYLEAIRDPAALDVEPRRALSHSIRFLRLMPALQTAEGAILADREPAANKTLALFGRAVVRDYINFCALARRFSLSELEASKDGGFTPSLQADALDYIEERDRETFNLDDETYDDLLAFAKSTAAQLREFERGLDDSGGMSII